MVFLLKRSQVIKSWIFYYSLSFQSSRTSFALCWRSWDSKNQAIPEVVWTLRMTNVCLAWKHPRLASKAVWWGDEDDHRGGEISGQGELASQGPRTAWGRRRDANSEHYFKSRRTERSGERRIDSVPLSYRPSRQNNYIFPSEMTCLW